MIRKVRRTRQARQDIIDIYRYVFIRSPSAADKVFEAIEKTIRGLSWFPGVGNKWVSPVPALRGLRYTTISGYRNFVVFFRVAGRVVEVLRIVSGARDLSQVVDDISTN